MTYGELEVEIGDRFVYVGKQDKHLYGKTGVVLFIQRQAYDHNDICRVCFDKGSSRIGVVYLANIIPIDKYLVDL
jgi:hypothetical protein